MLDILRKKSSTFAVYFVFAILIVIFAVGFGAVAPDKACGGGQPGSFQNHEYVELDGAESIDAAQVRMAMQLTGDAADPKRGFTDQNERFRYQTRFAFMNLYGPFSGGVYGQDPQQMSPVKLLKVTDELVETKLVAAYARSLGLGVSHQELNDALALLLSNDNFRDPKTGALEISAYRNWVARSLETSVSSFEKLVEEELLREKVIQLLVGELNPSDAEIEQAWKLEKDKVNLEYVSIDERSAAALVPVTDAEVSDWLGKNEDKAKAAYEEAKATKYTTPRQWKLRGIKVVAPDPTSTDDADQKKGFEDERNAAKAKAEKILGDVKTVLAEKKVPEPAEGEIAAPFDPVAAFAAIASAQSDDESKAQGGALGDKSAADLGNDPFGPAVKTAADGLKIGEASELIEVPTGFWILLPEAITEEQVKTYDDVKTEIAKGMVQAEKAGAFTKGLADEVLAEAKKDPTKALGEALKALNAKYGAAEGKGLDASTLGVSRLSRLAPGYPASSPYLLELGGRAPELVSAAFAAAADKPMLDKVFSVADGRKLVIARWTGTTAAEAMKDEDKTDLRQSLTIEKRRTVYRGWYQDLLAKKLASGEVEFTSDFEKDRKAAEEAFVQAGGQLPGVAAKPPEGAKPAEGAAP